MITTLRTVKERVLRLLNEDPILIFDSGDSGGGLITGGTSYSAEYVNDAVRAALDAISSRLWKTGLWSIDEAGSEFDDPPDDLMEILAVYDNSLGMYIPKQQMMPGLKTIDTGHENSWIDVPSGVLSFAAELKDVGAKVYYMAAWPMPEDEEEPLEPPDITLNAILFFACSYCLLQQAAGISTIRQFNTRIDSGKPTDNATNEMANYFLRRFDIEMQRIPLKVREQMQ